MEINVLNEIYDVYKTKLEEATLIWKSECCCISEDEDREIGRASCRERV